MKRAVLPMILRTVALKAIGFIGTFYSSLRGYSNGI
jgi:hypothetical protein